MSRFKGPNKPFTFDDIEEASDQSSDLEVQQPPPPPQPAHAEVIKREIIEIPVIYEEPILPKQQRIYYQPQEVQFDDFDIDEAPAIPEIIDVPHQEEEIVQAVVEEQIQEPQNDYMDDDAYVYRHEYLDDDFPQQHIEKDVDESLTSKKVSKVPLKVMSKRYNPKLCAVYLKLQGKEALLSKYQPVLNLEEQQPENNEPDEALEDLEVIGTFVRGLTKQKEVQQVLPVPSSSKSNVRTQQSVKPSPQAVHIMQSSIQQMKEKILQKQQQQKEREERQQFQQKQKLLLKLAQMKQVIQVLAKKIDKKVIMYKAKITFKQKESTSWMRYSELALIAKGLDEIYNFEKRMADKYYHQQSNKSTYMCHRISDGKIVDSCRIYAQPIPVKKQEEEQQEEKPKRSALLKLAQQKQKEDLELEKQIREQLEQKELDKLQKKEELKLKQKEFEFDQEYDLLDCDKIQIFKIVSDRAQRLEKRFEQKLDEALQVVPEQAKMISKPQPTQDPIKKQHNAKQSNQNKKSRKEDKFSASRLEGDKRVRKGWISTKREYVMDNNKRDKKKRVIDTSEKNDDFDETFQEGLQSFDNKGSIKEIVTGKKHTIFRTENGDVYSYGYGEYGALGHGGAISLKIPKKISRLNSVDFIACGEFHTLALQKGDLFAWGRGFEGQLGIRKDVDTASSPMFLSFFYRNPIKIIACGAYHSLAVDSKDQLYGWGEARFGQLGTGRKVKETLPTRIMFQEEGSLVQSQVKIATLNNQGSTDKIISVSGGYGHSAAVTSKGELYTWGFNQRGQLGHGDKKCCWYPKRVKSDILGNAVPEFQSVSLGYYTSFAIDIYGKLWSWGGGCIGHQNDLLSDLPRNIQLEDRRFSKVMANGLAAAFFAQMRIISMKPNLGPSSGGTLISLIGTGFCDTGRQSVRFIVGSQSIDVSCEYDHQTDSMRCQTPNFEDLVDTYPFECKVELTLDGRFYTECEQQFLIYSQKMVVSSLYPKCASINGGTSLVLTMNIDDKTTSYIKHLNVGFQPRKKKDDQKFIQKALNPMDLDVNDPELDKENWVCVEGFYEKGKISCVIPKVTSGDLNFSVDVSLNGQQFTGNPVVFRFYDITIKQLIPDNVMSEGGTMVKILGDGFFDTTNKKVIFKTQFGERLIEIMWDKQDRFYSLVAPPLTWLLGGQQPTPELLESVKQKGVEALLTLGGIEWISMGNFYYIDPEVNRLSPCNLDEKDPDRIQKLNAEEPLLDPFQGLTEPEKVKKQDEINKQHEADELEINYYFKKAHQYLYVYGNNLINTDKLIIQFIYGANALLVKGIFKNRSKLAVQIPELDLPTGIHDIGVEISLNGQQFSKSGKTFKYMAFDKAIPEAQRVKLEDEEVKKLKKTQPKKK